MGLNTNPSEANLPVFFTIQGFSSYISKSWHFPKNNWMCSLHLLKLVIRFCFFFIEKLLQYFLIKPCKKSNSLRQQIFIIKIKICICFITQTLHHTYFRESTFGFAHWTRIPQWLERWTFERLITHAHRSAQCLYKIRFHFFVIDDRDFWSKMISSTFSDK